MSKHIVNSLLEFAEEMESSGHECGFLEEAATEIMRLRVQVSDLEAERDRLKNLVAMAELAIGEHYAPSDCYSTGPLAGSIADHLCPACAFIAVLREGVK